MAKKMVTRAILHEMPHASLYRVAVAATIERAQRR